VQQERRLGAVILEIMPIEDVIGQHQFIVVGLHGDQVRTGEDGALGVEVFLHVLRQFLVRCRRRGNHFDVPAEQRTETVDAEAEDVRGIASGDHRPVAAKPVEEAVVLEPGQVLARRAVVVVAENEVDGHAMLRADGPRNR
jgi:hypothetical protein